MKISETDECKNLCSHVGGNGCCMLHERYGCSWKGNGYAVANSGGTGLAITCNKENELYYSVNAVGYCDGKKNVCMCSPTVDSCNKPEICLKEQCTED